MENFSHVQRVPIIKNKVPRPPVFETSLNGRIAPTSSFVMPDVDPRTLSIDNLVSAGVKITEGNTHMCENYDDSIEDYLSENIKQKIDVKHETEN